MPDKKLPDFTSEKEEARWYFEHRDELDDYFDPVSDEEADQLLAQLPPRDVAMAQAREASERYKALTIPTSIRLSREQIHSAKKIAARKGLKYQTWMKSIIHQAIETEK